MGFCGEGCVVAGVFGVLGWRGGGVFWGKGCVVPGVFGVLGWERASGVFWGSGVFGGVSWVVVCCCGGMESCLWLRPSCSAVQRRPSK